MDGIINILKPPGMTSFDVVSYLRGVLRTKKIGHTGTLDPGAVGVLPICIGKATKVIEYLTDTDKRYRAELVLGMTTDTQDTTGEILETKNIEVTTLQIQEAVRGFLGSYMQLPPMYSAVKVNGKKLYELARQGITIERSPREIMIHSIEILRISHKKEQGQSLASNNQFTRVLLDVSCSKGTYIRTLCADIGEKLGCGGCMGFLIRTKAGSFDIQKSITLEELQELVSKQTMNAYIAKIDEVLQDFCSVVVDPIHEKKFMNGLAVKMINQQLKQDEKVKVYNEKQEFIALGNVTRDKESTFIKSIKVFT